MTSTFQSGSDSSPDVEYFQQLADGAPVMIWMSGTDMGCFYFNRAWLEYRGRTTEEEFGNGWAEGVHPDDLERCVQHYANSFKQQVAFAMSYRLLHHTGEFRWILDRGLPHYTSDGQFLGFFGGCAETPADAAVARIQELRGALNQMRDFAERVAKKEVDELHRRAEAESLDATTSRLSFEQRRLHHAAEQISKLAVDMRAFERIPNGACYANRAAATAD